jgi:hypothetical protein
MVAGGCDIARFTCLDIFFCSFLDFGTGLIIADTPLIGVGLCHFVFDILDLWLSYHMSCTLALLLGLVPWLLAVLQMSYNLSSDD